MKEAEGRYGDAEPVYVRFSPEARELVKSVVNDTVDEQHWPGFPVQLQGLWSKFRGYTVRLALLLAACRIVNTREASASNSSANERVEPVDVVAAILLVNYFKNHARRAYAEIFGRDRLGTLTEDLGRFLIGREGCTWKGQPAELHAALRGSEALPKRADELTKMLKDIAKRDSRFTVKSAQEWDPEKSNSRRVLTVTLEIGVNGVKDRNGRHRKEDVRVEFGS